MAKEKVPAIQLSKTQQMKAFVANHKGEKFTASGLAKILGWSKRGGKVICHNSKAAVRLARRFGATVEHKKPEKVEAAGSYTIVL